MSFHLTRESMIIYFSDEIVPRNYLLCLIFVRNLKQKVIMKEKENLISELLKI